MPNVTHRIVAVDYDAKIGERLRLAFQPPEFEFSWFSDGREALASLPDIRPDVIVCDLLLPGISGQALLDEVKRSPGLRDVPFLILSTVRSQATIRAALDAGAEAFLLKPYPVQELVRAVRKLVERAAPQGVDAQSSTSGPRSAESAHVAAVTRISERNRQAGAHGALRAERVDRGGEALAAGANRISSLVDGEVARIATEARSGQKLAATTAADPRPDLLPVPAGPPREPGTAPSDAGQTASPQLDPSARAAQSEADERKDSVALDSVTLERTLLEPMPRPEPAAPPGAPLPQGRVSASRYARLAALTAAALALATLLFKVPSTPLLRQEPPEARSAAPPAPAATPTPAMPEPSEQREAGHAGDPQAAVHARQGDVGAPAARRVARPRRDSLQVVQGRLQWAQALYDAGRHEEARVALDAVFELDPSDPEARRLAARLDEAAANPAPIDPQTPAEQDRRAVQALLARYAAALQRKDLAALKAVWPGLDEIRVRERLQLVRAWSLTLQLLDLQVEGDVASALCESNDTLLSIDDEEVQNKSQVRFTLRRQDGSWLIDDMR